MSDTATAAHKAARREAFRWLERYHDTMQPATCCNGHLECSDVEGGRCLDQTLTEFPELDG